MDSPRFRGGRPQKLAPRRKVAEKVGYSDGGARRGALRARSNFFAPLELDLVGGVGLGRAGGHHQVGYRGNAGQGLATKSQCRYGVQLVLGLELAGGVALESQLQFVRRDACPVVGDPDVLDASTLYLHGQLGSAGVQGVFQQLFDHRRGTFDDFSGGDFAGQFGREHLYGHGRALK